jgi:hypothetical protein
LNCLAIADDYGEKCDSSFGTTTNNYGVGACDAFSGSEEGLFELFEFLGISLLT